MPDYCTHSSDERPAVAHHDASARHSLVTPAEPDATAPHPSEDAPCETGARHLTDDQLRALLDDVRARAAHAPHADASAIEAALANLECEAASRGIQLLPSDVPEPTPPRLAFRLFLKALATSDRGLLHRALLRIDAGDVFVAYRRIREHGDRSFRIFGLSRVLFRLDAGLLGVENAVARQEQLQQAGIGAADLEAFIELCITSMFAVACSGSAQGGER